MKKLDYLLIGVQKGGTSACLRNFNKNNNIFMLGNEVHYFDSDDNYQNYNYEDIIKKRCPNTYETLKKKIK